MDFHQSMDGQREAMLPLFAKYFNILMWNMAKLYEVRKLFVGNAWKRQHMGLLFGVFVVTQQPTFGASCLMWQ